MRITDLKYVAAVLIFGIAACDKMDATYKDFIKDGERVYVGKADSVKILPGKNRLLLIWLAISDPKIDRAKVYWHNRTDSTEIPIRKTENVDTVRLMLESLEEGDYSFDILTFDKEGNTSVVVNAVGHAYGVAYQQSLLSRPVKELILDNDTLKVVWGSPGSGAVRTELEYTNSSDHLIQITASVSEDTSRLENYKAGTSIRYRTVFMPDSAAIDTFYTSYVPIDMED